MGTVADKLARLQETKRAIRGALEEKGQPVADGDSFASYAEKLRAIDTSETARPADWLTLPDVSNAETETIVMLLHISPTGINEIAFEFQAYDANYTTFRLDWGDGTVENTDEIEIMESGCSVWHSYNYETIEAPVVENGEKEVVVRFENIGENLFHGLFSLSPIGTGLVQGGGMKNIYNETAMLKDMKVYALPSNNDFNVQLDYPIGLIGFDAWNIAALETSSCYSLRKVHIFGDRLKIIKLQACHNLGNLELPENRFTTFSFSGAKIDSLDIDASNLSSLSLSSLYNIRKLRLRGCKKPFNISYSKMDRAAFLELFESLGTVEQETRVRFLNSNVAQSLSDEDKSIATNKGWVVMTS